jgi:hypothetical protein
LKVLKAKNDKGNFTYAPSPKDTLNEVAAKLIGKNIAAECEEHHIPSTCEDDEDGWTIDALLLKPDAGR